MSRRPLAASGGGARPPMPPPAPSARAGGVSERPAGFAGGARASRGPAPRLASAALSTARSTSVLPAREHPETAPAAPKPAPGFHGAVSEFKRRLIETTLTELGGNRTRAARALGLQRTYLLRLMREFAVNVPATTGHPRRSPPRDVAAPLPTR